MTPDTLADTAAFLFGVERGAIFSHSRVARIAEARMALAWALRQAGWSLESIGGYLRRDHTTIIYSLETIERRARQNKRLAECLDVLKQPIAAPLDWIARIEALERRVAELEARLVV